MKNKLIILILFAVIITGCTNVKNLGKKLNKEEKIINNEKIQFLQQTYQNSDIKFTGREQGHKSCKCTQLGPDESCIKEHCEIIKGKFVWKYKVCSNKFMQLCIEPEYDDVIQNWNVYSSEEYKYINKVFEILDNNNITYSAYTSNPDGMSSCTIMIKKEKDASDLIAAIKEINKYYGSIYGKELHIDSDIVIFEEADYLYVYKKVQKNNDIHGNYDLYGILSGKDNFGKLIEEKEIDDDMFNCKTSSFSSVAYEILYDQNVSGIEIWCEGIK